MRHEDLAHTIEIEEERSTELRSSLTASRTTPEIAAQNAEEAILEQSAHWLQLRPNGITRDGPRIVLNELFIAPSAPKQ
jgi:hypothetical protein